ncbi:uncharacterized protein Z518_02935 [Rhinocladiella mackenziei CBS 650.93]|uniref:Rhinocladiella mackenziei CBS 650.93 unplaced genomic scaffold supercont1.2, whole genome shotgun sequence n=1 Tax=Rhinocladiella mackenziei CBS 650.93 TaxID=1442369 RepID=A0A0D2IQN2_9EURO|nr:uncharacterized protein Z518_02935 [Rhinocladiella mackenziei CBS 650.93]KIX08279.1 hypothetical protein Z518_02935 [Rhinocladiella mackenziei CBS 650.93]
MTHHTDRANDADAHNLPCPAQIAFALTTVQSKPPQVPIEDYLASLRKAVTAQSTNSPSTLDFDTSIHWRQSYARAESERLRLLNEVAELKQERDVLRVQKESHHPHEKAVLGKRKRDATSIPKNDTRQKSKPQDPRLEHSDDDIRLQIGDINPSNLYRHTFLRGTASLHRELRLRTSNQEKLVAAIQAISGAITRTLEPADNETRHCPARVEGQSADELCRLFSQAYPSILQSLESVQPESIDDGLQILPGLSDIVRIFQSLLGHLHKLSLDEFVRQEREARSKKNRARRRASAIKRASPKTTVENSAQNARICRMLVKMVTMLDLSHNTHCELLEGILCTLLDHIGSALSLVVFTDPNRRDRPGILPPSGLLDVAHIDSVTAIGTVQIEGPYLIWVLHQILEFLYAKTKCMSEQSRFIFSLQSQNRNRGKNLRKLIEDTLQNTLLRAVFGDEDDKFHNALRRNDDDCEKDLTELLQELGETDQDSAEWFIGKLWEHLGWDILSGNRGV